MPLPAQSEPSGPTEWEIKSDYDAMRRASAVVINKARLRKVLKLHEQERKAEGALDDIFAKFRPGRPTPEE